MTAQPSVAGLEPEGIDNQTAALVQAATAPSWPLSPTKRFRVEMRTIGLCSIAA